MVEMPSRLMRARAGPPTTGAPAAAETSEHASQHIAMISTTMRYLHSKWLGECNTMHKQARHTQNNTASTAKL
jgi:hypothetical protein